MLEPDLEGVDKACRFSCVHFFTWQIIARWTRASSFEGQSSRLVGCKGCFGCPACRWRIVVTEDLGILNWWAISLYIWSDLCNSRIAEIVSDKYSRLKLLGLEDIIKFDVLVVEKFAVEHFAIFCVPLGKRYRLLTFYTRFVQLYKCRGTAMLKRGTYISSWERAREGGFSRRKWERGLLEEG